MTDAPRVSENVIRQLRFIIADQLSIHRDLVTQPMTLKTPSWEALRDMCDELLALRTPAQEAGDVPRMLANLDEMKRNTVVSSHRDAIDEIVAHLRSSPAASPVTVGERDLSLDAPFLRDVVDKLRGQGWASGEGSAIARMEQIILRLQQPAEPVSKSVAKRIAAQKGEPYPFTAEPVCERCKGKCRVQDEEVGAYWPCPSCTSPTGLTREEVEALEAAIHQLEELADATEFSGQYKQDPARKHITTLRNLAARK
jgi:hypothetical protein